MAMRVGLRPAAADSEAALTHEIDVSNTLPRFSWPAEPVDVVELEVILPDGRALPEGRNLLGRKPVQRLQEDIDALIVIDDATVSKTHALVVVAADEIHITDRASRNGTMLHHPDGTLLRCPPWRGTRVSSPATVHLGHTRLLVRRSAHIRPTALQEAK